MPLIIGWIIGGFVTAAGTLVGKVLMSLAIGYVVYSGVDTSMAWAKAAFLSGVSGMPAKAIAMAGVLKVGVCVSLMLSALTTRLVMSGLTSGSIKRLVQK